MEHDVGDGSVTVVSHKDIINMRSTVWNNYIDAGEA